MFVVIMDAECQLLDPGFLTYCFRACAVTSAGELLVIDTRKVVVESCLPLEAESVWWGWLVGVAGGGGWWGVG